MVYSKKSSTSTGDVNSLSAFGKRALLSSRDSTTVRPSSKSNSNAASESFPSNQPIFSRNSSLDTIKKSTILPGQEYLARKMSKDGLLPLKIRREMSDNFSLYSEVVVKSPHSQIIDKILFKSSPELPVKVDDSALEARAVPQHEVHLTTNPPARFPPIRSVTTATKELGYVNIEIYDQSNRLSMDTWGDVPAHLSKFEYGGQLATSPLSSQSFRFDKIHNPPVKQSLPKPKDPISPTHYTLPQGHFNVESVPIPDIIPLLNMHASYYSNNGQLEDVCTFNGSVNSESDRNESFWLDMAKPNFIEAKKAVVTLVDRKSHRPIGNRSKSETSLHSSSQFINDQDTQILPSEIILNEISPSPPKFSPAVSPIASPRGMRSPLVSPRETQLNVSVEVVSPPISPLGSPSRAEPPSVTYSPKPKPIQSISPSRIEKKITTDDIIFSDNLDMDSLPSSVVQRRIVPPKVEITSPNIHTNQPDPLTDKLLVAKHIILSPKHDKNKPPMHDIVTEQNNVDVLETEILQDPVKEAMVHTDSTDNNTPDINISSDRAEVKLPVSKYRQKKKYPWDNLSIDGPAIVDDIPMTMSLKQIIRTSNSSYSLSRRSSLSPNPLQANIKGTNDILTHRPPSSHLKSSRKSLKNKPSQPTCITKTSDPQIIITSHNNKCKKIQETMIPGSRQWREKQILKKHIHEPFPVIGEIKVQDTFRAAFEKFALEGLNRQ